MSEINYRTLIAPPGLSKQDFETITRLSSKTYDDAVPTDIVEIRDLLQRVPALSQQIGDIANTACDAVLAYASPQLIVQESIRLTAAELSQALTLPTDTPLEKLAITQCVTAHILHASIQTYYANIQSGEPDLALADHWERRLDNSQRRYLRALEALARLRRLALPTFQINIAETQTNIASNVPPSPSDIAGERDT